MDFVVGEIMTAAIADFGEDVEYLPRDGIAREVKALVDRSPAEPVDALGGRVLGRRIELMFLNDPLAGVTADEIDTGGDAVRVPLIYGRDPVELNITTMVEHDPGAVKVSANY